MFPDNQELYNIQQNVAITSPMSVFMPPPDYEIVDQLDGIGTKKGDNFRRRCMVLDHNKSSFDYLSKKISDYLIIDIADSRLPIANFSGNHYASYAIYSSRYRKQLEDIFGEIKIHKFDYWSKEQWKECIDWYCEQLLKLYGRRNIILNEIYCVDEYITKSKNIKKFTKNRIKKNVRINEHLKYIFDLCESKLKGCHVIRMPENVFADASHKLGLLPLHFHKLYYDYAFQALQIITNCDSADEEFLLEDLKNRYSSLLKLEYYEIKNKQLESKERKNKKYISCFKEIIRNQDEILYCIERLCNENKLNSIALYGNNEISGITKQFFEKCGVSVDYIISWGDNCYGITHILPNTVKIPDTDAIIVCSTKNISEVISRLEKKTDVLLVDVNDLIFKRIF